MKPGTKIRMTNQDSFWRGQVGEVVSDEPESPFLAVRFPGGVKGYSDVSVLRGHVERALVCPNDSSFLCTTGCALACQRAVRDAARFAQEFAVPIEDRDEQVAVSIEWVEEESPDLTFIGIEEYEFEQRVTDGETGGQKGRKLARFALIPWQALRALARHYGIGALKYDEDNWRKGYDWDLSVDALERHFNAWKGGESVYVEKFEGRDGRRYEVETHHLIAVAWQAFTLYIFERLGLGRDTRHIEDGVSS